MRVFRTGSNAPTAPDNSPSAIVDFGSEEWSIGWTSVHSPWHPKVLLWEIETLCPAAEGLIVKGSDPLTSEVGLTTKQLDLVGLEPRRGLRCGFDIGRMRRETSPPFQGSDDFLHPAAVR